MDNKIAAKEVGKDLQRVTNTLVETATESERKVEKNVRPMALCCMHCISNILTLN